MFPTGDGEFPNACAPMTKAAMAAEHTSAGYAALAQISEAFEILSFVEFVPKFLIPADSGRPNRIFLEFPAAVTWNLSVTPLWRASRAGPGNY